MRALITGISGQDGYFMAELLQGKGYTILGLTSSRERALQSGALAGLADIDILEFDYFKRGEIDGIIKDFAPTVIFNFGGMATGHGMFSDPLKMSRVNGEFVVDMLEAIRRSGTGIRLCQASSSEMFGRVTCVPQNEDTPFRPRSPYAAAKLYAHTMCGVYRDAFGVGACSAILYNHESERRSVDYVTKKIAATAVAISLGREQALELGSLDGQRDWGCAREYVQAMYLMATSEAPRDYVVATGRLTTVRRLCEIAFQELGLDYLDHVRLNPEFRRPFDSSDLRGDASRILTDLGWQASTDIEDIMINMVRYELAAQQTSAQQ